MKTLADIAEGLEKLNSEMVEADVAEEVMDIPDAAAELFANAIAVALSQVEQMGQTFDSPKEATAFASKTMKSLLGSRKSLLMKRMAKFERQGADKTISYAKRSLKV